MHKDSILNCLYQAHRYLTWLETHPRDYGTGEKLYASYIHAIVAVNNHPGINLTGLAETLNISKPAVSKITNKLIEKEYILKSRAIGNDKEVLFHPSERGITAAEAHDRFEEEQFGELIALENTLSPEDRRIILDFMYKLNRLKK